MTSKNQPRKISLTGLDDLSRFEMGEVETILHRAYDKLTHQTPIAVKIHVKKYHETGSKHKTSIVIDATADDGERFKATADAWDLHEALRDSFEKLEWQVRKHEETK